MKILDLFETKPFDNTKIRDPYIIAEAGVNHEGDFNIARRLIAEAAEAGADAIKFQTYKANTIASVNSPAYWDLSKESTESQYKLFQKYDKFWKKEYELLKKYCDSDNIEFLSTPFDIESAKFLNELMNVFKISSSDITNKPFIEYICNFNKPIILSTGASTLDEIKQAKNWIDFKKIPLAILHCILNYPTEDDNAHLGMIKDLQKEFPLNIIGYSDHTLPKNMKVLETAVMLGSAILEKHFTHDKSLNGNDHYHSMDKIDLLKFKKELKKILKIIGFQKKNFLDSEIISRKNARRSIVAFCNIPKDSVILEKHLTWKRPATGISPKDIKLIKGKRAKINIREDDLILFENIY